MTQIIAGTKTEFSIDPAILNLLPAQGSVELQRDAAGALEEGAIYAIATRPRRPAPKAVRDCIII